MEVGEQYVMWLFEVFRYICRICRYQTAPEDFGLQP